VISRRKFVRNSAVAAGGLMLFGPSAFAGVKKIRIGVLAPSHCALPVLLAESRGHFKRNGVNVELVFAKGVPEILKGLGNKSLDFGQVVSPVAFGATAGHPKLPNLPLSAVQVLGTDGGVLSVSTYSGIESLSGLAGKTLGVHNPFMIHSLILNTVLEKQDLLPGRDIEIKTVPMSQMGKALADKQIDGFINPEPIPTILENKRLSKTLLLTNMFWHNHPCCMLVSRKSFFDEEKQLIKDVALSSMVAGLELDGLDSRKQALTEIHDNYDQYQRLSFAFMMNAFKQGRTGFYPFPYQSAGILIVKRMKEAGLIPESAGAKDLVQSVFRSQHALEMMLEAVKHVPGAKAPAGLSRQEKGPFSLGV